MKPVRSQLRRHPWRGAMRARTHKWPFAASTERDAALDTFVRCVETSRTSAGRIVEASANPADYWRDNGGGAKLCAVPRDQRRLLELSEDVRAFGGRPRLTRTSPPPAVAGINITEVCKVTSDCVRTTFLTAPPRRSRDGGYAEEATQPRFEAGADEHDSRRTLSKLQCGSRDGDPRQVANRAVAEALEHGGTLSPIPH